MGPNASAWGVAWCLYLQTDWGHFWTGVICIQDPHVLTRNVQQTAEKILTVWCWIGSILSRQSTVSHHKYQGLGPVSCSFAVKIPFGQRIFSQVFQLSSFVVDDTQFTILFGAPFFFYPFHRVLTIYFCSLKLSLILLLICNSCLKYSLPFWSRSVTLANVLRKRIFAAPILLLFFFVAHISDLYERTGIAIVLHSS